ncbi:PREDICTED: protein ARMCX6-like, partial [Elephantulus edwardii]|uniref:protein ARMCX6-like n=1 Tax=Elephantulus edwardii TaxID=28737 RepID=UPI0003F0BC92
TNCVLDLSKSPLIQVKVRSQLKDAGLYSISDHLASLCMGQIKRFINRMYLNTVSHCCNSFLQQTRLNLLISMAAIHHMPAKSILGLKCPLKSEGRRCIRDYVWRLLVELPEKPALAVNSGRNGGWTL